MAPSVTMILLALLEMISVALAAPHINSLQKRSFHAHARGRQVSGYEEIQRAHRKYWESIVSGGEGYHHADAVPSYSIRASQVPVSSAPIQLTHTVFVTATAPSATGPPEFVSSSASLKTSTSSTSRAPTTTASNEDGEATAVPEENESEYLTETTVGGQKVNLNFDTGSADLWVFSSLLSQSALGDHSFYNPNNSDTFESYDGATWQIRYGDGSSASGVVGYDVVDVGGTTVQKQCVELATQLSRAFIADDASDGLLGLGFSTISTVKPVQQKTFFENVMPQLSSPVFTADLEETSGAGTYEFGRIDPAKYHGEIHYTPIDNSDGWWQFDSPSYSVDGQESPCTYCTPAIADTGTSLVYMDTDIVRAYYASVSSAFPDTSQGGWVFDCTETLPSFGLAVGDYMAVINGTDMAYAPLDDGSGMCYGGLQEGPGDVQIVGDVFLKQFFAVFDGGENRFGVALKN
ncbi:unnamed protein product [Zymoseptoria tritici ST99CH_1E4]|uniref:Peptidase A1 domain-containing protein n=1 Tax=Zymoseptoria tritici ST99CH_1E4 TaxID=1276532 RepID=A0A2H1GY40_ZYMTR|nr:unnamed protein product [Zymoseptoria tritici ST99CH_1E4]